MTIQRHDLSNDDWRVGILPNTGASIAFGRVRHHAAQGGAWVDVLRPTAEADYGNSSNGASFIMLPWANRIRDGVLRLGDQTWQLATTKDDGTARHGTVRHFAWNVVSADDLHIRMSFDSAAYQGVNFPFHFSATAEYRLDGRDFTWRLIIQNMDTQPFPCGFGHHPYFVRNRAHEPEILIPCDLEYRMEKAMPSEPPVPISPRLDFRQWRALDNNILDDLLTGRQRNTPLGLRFPDTGVELSIHADDIFKHVIAFAPDHPALPPYFALEPQTNANDGFNLHARGIDTSGVIVLQPGATAAGDVVLRIEKD